MALMYNKVHCSAKGGTLVIQDVACCVDERIWTGAENKDGLTTQLNYFFSLILKTNNVCFAVKPMMVASY